MSERSQFESFFEDIIKNKHTMTSSNSGNDFEDNLRRCLRNRGFDFAKPEDDHILKD